MTREGAPIRPHVLLGSVCVRTASSVERERRSILCKVELEVETGWSWRGGMSLLRSRRVRTLEALGLTGLSPGIEKRLESKQAGKQASERASELELEMEMGLEGNSG